MNGTVTLKIDKNVRIACKLGEILRRRKISPKELSEAASVDLRTIKFYISNNFSRIDCDVITAIMIVLKIEMKDLFYLGYQTDILPVSIDERTESLLDNSENIRLSK